MRERPVRLQVTRRCPQVERTMTPVEDGWHCAGCDKVVLDLRDLTRREALELMRARRDERTTCIVVDADEWGRSVFAGETFASLRRAASGVAIAAALAACGPDASEATPPASSASSVAPAPPPSEPAPPLEVEPASPADQGAAAADSLAASDAGTAPEAAADVEVDAGPAPEAQTAPRRRRRRPVDQDPLVGLAF